MIRLIKSKVKQLILKSTGKFSHLKKGVKCKCIWYGNRYGGFYVCPIFLNKNSIIYSFGIGEDISFDKAIIENHDCQVFGFDPTPKAIDWVRSQNLPAKFNFFDFGISNKSGFVDFYLPKNLKHVSGSYIIQNNISVKEKIIVKMKSFEDIIIELGHKHIDVLKMDVEGAEYDVIEDMLNTKISINQFLIEFHERLFENGKSKTQKIIKKLNSNGYEIFAISDSFEEISFINKNIL
jgi:FkbM family methyltransferase